MWFDESRLDDEQALASVDLRLRTLAESGARVRREAALSEEAVATAVARSAEAGAPRAVVAAGPDARLLRAVLEPWCPVPFVAWPGPGLPGWAGGLDLVVVLAPEGSDPGAASAVAEAARRGCQLVVACPAESLVAEHATGRWTTVVPTDTSDPLATAVTVLSFLDRARLGPTADPEQVAVALDRVAVDCSPFRDLSVNPAKQLAIALADAAPVVWGGSVLAARAARRVAETLRRATGRPALAGDAEHLLPLLEAARPRDLFDDPYADDSASPRPVLIVLDDGSEDPVVLGVRDELARTATDRGVRVETVRSQAATEVAAYAELLLVGTYAGDYLRLGLVEE